MQFPKVEFHRLHIRLEEPKKPAPKPGITIVSQGKVDIETTALIPVGKEVINADEIRDQLTPGQQKKMDEHFAKKAPKKYVPKDKTPFLAELQQEIVPRLTSFHESLVTVNTSAAAIKPMKVLSIDPGTTNVALCFIDRENGQHMTSKIDFPDEIKAEVMRLRYLEHVIEQWIRFFRPDVIFIEGVAHMARRGVSDSGKREYLIERLAIDYNVPFVVIPTMRMRSFIEASGKEHNKSDIKLQVFKKFDAEFNSEDECDAFAIAQTGIAMLEKTWIPGTKPAKKSKKK